MNEIVKKMVRCKRVVAQEFSQRLVIVIRNTSCGGSISFQVSLVWQELKTTGYDNYVNEPKGINHWIWTARSSKC